MGQILSVCPVRNVIQSDTIAKSPNKLQHPCEGPNVGRDVAVIINESEGECLVVCGQDKSHHCEWHPCDQEQVEFPTVGDVILALQVSLPDENARRLFRRFVCCFISIIFLIPWLYHEHCANDKDGGIDGREIVEESGNTVQDVRVGKVLPPNSIDKISCWKH